MRANSRRSMVSAIAGFLALGLFLIGLIYWAISTPPFNFNIGQWDVTLRVLMVGAIIAFSVFLIAAPESVGATVGKRSTKLTANALIVSLVAIGIAIAINVLFETIPAARADFTANKDFSLSDQTLSVLSEIEQNGKPVKATAFYSNLDPGAVNFQQMEDLLKEYSARSGSVTYEIVDHIRNPSAQRALGSTRSGQVVFDNGEKREIADSVSEAQFTSALARLLQDQVRTVAFLTGHGERSFESFEQNGYQQITAALEGENYQVVSWNLVVSPTLTLSNATVLVIADPRQAIGVQDMQRIQTYLDGGGRALILLDPQMPAEAVKPLADLLARYGVETVQGAVVDRKSASATDPTLVVVDDYPSREITEDLQRAPRQITLFPFSMGFKPPTSTVGGLEVLPLIMSSPSVEESWLETNLQSQQVTYNEGADLPGPVTMAIQLAAPAASAAQTETTSLPKTRIVAYGDADFASNIFAQQVPANVDLLANSVAWLAGANELVSIRAKEATAPRYITLDTGQKNLIFTSAVLALPVLVLIIGVFNWWRRR
jgi:ABC-type uncharacterized transport system involved in gliding motility auxiliary subunit